ncbi:unnamed protein product [Ectocarpus sp. 12 AP-2014]
MSTMDLEIAAGYGECSVCFEHLCAKGASVMVDGSGQQAGFLRAERPPRRVCRHFLCQECAPTIIPRKCPVCRRDFVSTLDVPDPITNPVRWFHVVDRDQNGSIEKSELVDALKGMFPVEPGALEEIIEMNWRSWDTDNNGTLDTAEFRNRLAPFLAQSIGNMRQRITPQLPDLKDQPAEWFKYWDEDESGSLERPEIVRALIKTMPEFTGRDEGWLGGTFAAIWSIIDPDEDGSITGAEFMMPGGLYETLVANFCRHRIGG